MLRTTKRFTCTEEKVRTLLEWCRDNFDYEVPEELKEKDVWLEVIALIDEDTNEVYAVQSYITDGNSDLCIIDEELYLGDVCFPKDIENQLFGTLTELTGTLTHNKGACKCRIRASEGTIIKIELKIIDNHSTIFSVAKEKERLKCFIQDTPCYFSSDTTEIIIKSAIETIYNAFKIDEEITELMDRTSNMC